MKLRRRQERRGFAGVWLFSPIPPLEKAMAERETGNLIGSDKVEGTAVYGADQEKIGSIERVMIDKVSGKVAYAVLSYGGFLGIGDDHYPTPWSSLTYDTNLGGYRTNITKDQLDKAPRYASENDWSWNRENDQRVYDYYQASPYW
jgi:PRC-barrel domain